MNRLLIIAMLVLAGFQTGCETIEGAGKDIQSLGGAVEDAAEETDENL